MKLRSNLSNQSVVLSACRWHDRPYTIHRSRKLEIESFGLWEQFLKMPIIFEKDGFKFFFYSNDHEPIHVHVRYSGGEAVFNFNDTFELRESRGLKIKELSKAQSLAEANKQLIIEKWNEHLNQ